MYWPLLFYYRHILTEDLWYQRKRLSCFSPIADPCSAAALGSRRSDKACAEISKERTLAEWSCIIPDRMISSGSYLYIRASGCSLTLASEPVAEHDNACATWAWMCDVTTMSKSFTGTGNCLGAPWSDWQMLISAKSADSQPLHSYPPHIHQHQSLCKAHQATAMDGRIV